MGIPSYFSQIIKKYPSIVRNLKQHRNVNTHFHNLYMDCNSIIYDAVRSLNSNEAGFESRLIQQVVANIEAYIIKINPSNTIIIAFDGVAPFAKMNQQKTRRYKSAFMSKIDNAEKMEWSTSNITPGTQFMNELSKQMISAFSNTETKYNVKKVIVTGADEQGEGEHKIFKYIRDNPNINDNVMIYGLDSDLIMLSIFHRQYFNNGYVFREAPEFMKSSIKVDDSDEPYVLDMGLLGDSIMKDMNCKFPDKQRIHDYVFMCFLLGNDFLPHFPALNIRTNGISVLLETYVEYLGKYPHRFFIDDGKIQWQHFASFIRQLAKNEHVYILNEYRLRDKHDQRVWKTDTVQDKANATLNIPIIYRGEEKYICPTEKNWEERYYKALFHSERNPKSVCINYMEGLEWVFKYYSGDCPDWRWTYEYNYPPLLVDLQHYIPDCDTTFILKARSAFSPNVQLAYVLPFAQFELLPEKTRQFLTTRYIDYYKDDADFHWAFCRYFWEAHVYFKSITANMLDSWEIALN
jgi:5'-3' exonuclease